MSDPTPAVENPYRTTVETTADEGRTTPSQHLSLDNAYILEPITIDGEPEHSGVPPVPDASTRPSLGAQPGVSIQSDASQPSHVAEPEPRPSPESVGPPVSAPPEAVEARNANQHPDPKLAGLQAMFPGFDVSIMQVVLEECGGDPDRAIDTLLGMSDPSYHSTHAQTPSQPRDTHLDLDEELARKLQLEEQQSQQSQGPHPYDSRRQRPPVGQDAHYGYANQSGGTNPAQDLSQTVKNFISGASSKMSGTGFGRGGAGSNPGGGDFRQQLNQFAETGKNTFNSLMYKAKAKIQEYNANQPGAPANSAAYAYPERQSAPGAYNAAPSMYNQAGASYYVPSPGSQPTYMNPPRSEPEGYHIIPTPERTSVEEPRVEATRLGVAPSLPTRSSFDSPAGAEATRASFDTSRLGLKPKKPVSLIGANIQQSAPSSPSNVKGKSRARDDDIEYVTSPFEDER